MRSILNSIFVLFAASALAVTAYAAEPEQMAALDLADPCALGVEQLAPALGGMEDYAADFLIAERRYGVNAVFLASLAAFESGWGRYCVAENNIFGWGAAAYSSKGECIDAVAESIARLYLSPNGPYHRGRKLSGVNAYYNGSVAWLRGMMQMMAQISTEAGWTPPEGSPEISTLPFSGEEPEAGSIEMTEPSTSLSTGAESLYALSTGTEVLSTETENLYALSTGAEFSPAQSIEARELPTSESIICTENIPAETSIAI